MPPPNRDSGARNSASSPALRKTAIDGRWPQRASTKRAATLDSALDRSVRVPPPRLARIAADRRPRPCDPRAPGRSVRRSAARRTARATCLAEEPAAHSTGRSTGGQTCGRRRLSRPRGRSPWPGPRCRACDGAIAIRRISRRRLSTRSASSHCRQQAAHRAPRHWRYSRTSAATYSGHE